MCQQTISWITNLLDQLDFEEFSLEDGVLEYYREKLGTATFEQLLTELEACGHKRTDPGTWATLEAMAQWL